MDEEPPPPTDSPPAIDSGEEKHPSVLQCEEFARDAAAEELARSNDESSIPIVQCVELRSDGGEERGSVAAEGEEKPGAVEEENPALRQEEEEEADGEVLKFESSVDEIMQENVEEKLIVDDRPQPTEELNGNRPEIAEGDQGIKAPIAEASICNVAVDEVAERYIEELILDADGPQPPEECNGERPRIGAHLLGEHKEEDKCPISETATVDEIMHENVEEKLLDVDCLQPTGYLNGERPQLAEEGEKDLLGEHKEEDKGPISETATVDEIMHVNVEEKLLDVECLQPTGYLNGGRPQLTEEGEKYLLGEHKEEDKCLIDETATVDEIMHENVEEKLLDVDCLQPTGYLNGERPQLAEEGEKAHTLEKPPVGDEKGSSPEEESEEKEEEEEEKVPLFNEIMQENITKKLQDCNGKEPAKQLEEERLHDEVSSFQEKNVGEEEKLVTSELFGSVAEGEEDKHKLSEGQLNEEKPESVKKRKKASSSQRRLLEEEKEDKASSLQEESAAGVQDESAEDSDEKEDADEMDTDEGGPARAAGKRTGSKRKRGRPPVPQREGRRTRAPPRPKEDEELCFICFDGGDLVVCDHRGCPKVYHPSCVNRDEAYFKAKGQWTCGILLNL